MLRGGRHDRRTHEQLTPYPNRRPSARISTDRRPAASQKNKPPSLHQTQCDSLLERVIAASSKEGDVVLDPFCGCGTTIAVAARTNRRWVGIDITHLATSLIKVRLRDHFGPEIEKTYRTIGEPTSLPDAQMLAAEDQYQFQWWALGLVGARPEDQKKGADRGIDGRLFFHDEGPSGETKQIVFSVKAGKNVGVAMIRDLGHVLTRENAQIGVFITMTPPTQPMRTEAATAGFYVSPWNGQKYPRLQILTVEQILEGKGINYPAISGGNRTFREAPKAQGPRPSTPGLFDPN